VAGEAGIRDLLQVNLPDLPGGAAPIGGIYDDDGTRPGIDNLLQIVFRGFAAIEKAATDLPLQVANQRRPNPIVPSERIADSQDHGLFP